MDETEIERVADTLLEAYCEKKRIANPGYNYYRTERYDKVFNRAAKICLANKFSPHGYVQACWSAIGDKSKFYPEALLNAKVVAAEFATPSLDYQAVFDQQVNSLTNLVAKGSWGVRAALLHPVTGLYAWFRIISTAEPDEKIMDKYKHIAKLECTPALLSFLQENGYDSTRITR